MTTDRQTREELNALSLAVFGSSSRWQKLVKNGYTKLKTRTVKELVPSEVEGEEPKEIEVEQPILLNGAKQSELIRLTVDGVREMMLELQAKREAFWAQLQKQREDQEAARQQAELEKKVQDTASGATGV